MLQHPDDGIVSPVRKNTAYLLTAALSSPSNPTDVERASYHTTPPVRISEQNAPRPFYYLAVGLCTYITLPVVFSRLLTQSVGLRYMRLGRRWQRVGMTRREPYMDRLEFTWMHMCFRFFISGLSVPFSYFRVSKVIHGPNCHFRLETPSLALCC